MTKHLPLLAALLLAAGCAQQASHDTARAPAAAKPAAASMAGAWHSQPISLATAKARHGGQVFADAPDRGELLAYPSQRVVRADGAYTWHRTDLSEVHALRALSSRVLRLTTPSGEALSFRLERSVEHPSGDWTWIGKRIGGDASAEAILTFGAKAVFGSIAQPGGKAPLKLTMRDGVSWLVETDLAKVAQIDNEATRPTREDYLVVPRLEALRRTGAAAAAPSAGPSTAAAPASANAVQTLAGPTVDLVLGYTSGFAAGLGGASQANTRLAYMVDVTNQAYVNSQVPGSVRLVKTVEVNYPDNTSNSDTLEKLTGYRSGSGQVTPDPAFAELRAARDTYGADLVSLVRKFNTPENDGCGIAWLIGGGSTGVIDRSDAFFGYSVVSDGRDAGTDGKNYFCREETLAHELGHNMGSQHDRATATTNGSVSTGVYPYSFGYKTDANTGNFYDIMAYGDPGQTPYRVFSNPRITFCGGAPCGVDNQADVARSLTNTMPAVATFRATVVPPKQKVRRDFTQDGVSDLYWYNQVSGQASVWTMAGGAPTGASIVHREPDLSWSPMGSGDFNGDGYADVWWRNRNSGQNFVQFMQGVAVLGSSGLTTTVADAAWKIVAYGDFNGDGITDVYWRNTENGYTAMWLMDGTIVRTNVYVHRETDQNWKVVGSGDFNADGYDDILWRNAINGANYVHLMAGTNILAGSGALPSVNDGNWEIAAVGDFTGNGRADIYWRNKGSGANSIWSLNGASLLAINQPPTESDLNWKVASTGDFNADGTADLVWRNQQSGRNVVQLFSGGAVANVREIDAVQGTAWQMLVY